VSKSVSRHCHHTIVALGLLGRLCHQRPGVGEPAPNRATGFESAQTPAAGLTITVPTNLRSVV